MNDTNKSGDDKSVNAWWSRTPEALFKELNSSSQGLTSSEAQARLVRYGRNVLVEKGKVTAPMLFLAQFKSPIILILLFATAVSAYLGDWQDSIIILAIILGSAILSFVQEYQANNAAEKLRSSITARSNVMRDSKVITIPTVEVAKGDVVMLSAGSLIPADGLVLEARDFFVNQAVLTGETFPVEKCTDAVPAGASLAERTNTVFMGTNVSSGSATVLIVETGSGTSYGQIAQHLALRPPETEFERGIRQFGLLLSEVMLILVLAIFAFNVYFQKPPVDSLLFSIALAVGLTPQLLPAIININLSRGSQAMAKDGVIVRRLAAIENFGSMDVFCTDKTGTLTLGIVKLDGAVGLDGEPSDAVFQDAYLNAHYQTGLSNALDEAIQKSKELDVHLFEKIDEIPYDFVRKRLSVVVEKDGTRRMITKGALENILSVCSQATRGAGPLPLDANLLADIRKRYADWSEQGYRVLGLAEKGLDAHPETKVYPPQTETGMIFMGFLLFLDPPKPGVAETIKDLKSLGVSLKVITGDNHLVANHLAQSIGMDVMGVLTGSELTQMRDEALLHAVEHTNLFTEVDPNQKERIIHALQKRGHVVGYMGDGVNDAPALHTADVGISVDSAVDVAKEAADFVLLKQDLAVLHKGIQQGRKTFANTMKYVFMATSANFGNMFSVAGASLFLSFLPMLPKQILLINFLTDFPEMTIASDNVDPQMIQEPHRWDISFIRSFMFLFGPLSSVFDFLTFGALLLLFHATPELFRTGWFVESVASATLVVFAVRTRLPFTSSKPSRLMLAVTVAVILVTVAIPYTPLGTLMAFAPLPLSYLAVILAIVTLYFFSAEFTKRWFYRTKPMK
jgi:Mg2+-importing ATPase